MDRDCWYLVAGLLPPRDAVALGQTCAGLRTVAHASPGLQAWASGMEAPTPAAAALRSCLACRSRERMPDGPMCSGCFWDQPGVCGRLTEVDWYREKARDLRMRAYALRQDAMFYEYMEEDILGAARLHKQADITDSDGWRQGRLADAAYGEALDSAYREAAARYPLTPPAARPSRPPGPATVAAPPAPPASPWPAGPPAPPPPRTPTPSGPGA